MAARSGKRPFANALPVDRKEPRTSASNLPSQHDRDTIVWAFSIVDRDGKWGWQNVASPHWWSKILPKLQHFESMTWASLLGAAGGRSRGTNHHPVSVSALTKQAKNRLREIKQDDVAELFSLRLDGTTRIYGIRDRRVLKLLWYDPFHGMNARAVCPVSKR